MEEMVRKNCCLKESSLNRYLTNLKNLKKIIKYEKDDLDFLKKSDEIVKTIEKEYPNLNTRKTYFATVFSVIKENPDFTEQVKKTYHNKMLNLREIITDKIGENKMSEKQEKNWVEYSELQKVPDKIEEQLKKLKEGTPEHFDLYHKWLIIYLNTNLPPMRLDLPTIKIYLTPSEFSKENYIVIKSKKEIDLYMNDFKNVKSFGKTKMSYPDTVSKEINKYLDYLKKYNYSCVDGEYLFFSPKTKKAYSQNYFGKFLPTIFQKYLGKPITINDIRHIYETTVITSPEYSKKTLKEKEQIHKKLLHNFRTAQEYVKLGKFIEFFETQKPKSLSLSKDKDKIAELLRSQGIEIED
jgi:hypothetical protein